MPGLWREACCYMLGLEAVWGDHDKESQNVAYVCERRDISIGNEKSFREVRHAVTFWVLGDSG